MTEARIRMLLFDTQADNTPAIKFFKRKGFENPTKHVYLTLNLQKEG
jgi:ribosomal protein S18 acetylase RimI-like enzyme